MAGFVRKGWFGNLVLLVLALSLFEQCNCQGKGYTLAPICAKVECPNYYVIESTKDFEIRSYKQANWVLSPVINSTSSYQEGSTRGFSYLFAYINGQNKQSAIINMTAPILTDISFAPAGNRLFVSSFYLPQNYQNTPPESEFVRLAKLPAEPYAAVRRFSGSVNADVAAVELETLKKSLIGGTWEAAVKATSTSVAGYNSPCEKLNRVNEVIIWFTK